jgi:hypothetical protein
MACEVVRLALGEAEGKTPHDRRLRAYLASCEDCRAFQRSIRSRRSALAAGVPTLAPRSAGDILARLLERGSNSGAGLAAAGGTAAGGLAKLAGASGPAKLAAGAAAVGTAVVVGGFVAAGYGMLGGGDPAHRPERPGFLGPDSAQPSAGKPPPARALPTGGVLRPVSRLPPRPPCGRRRASAGRCSSSAVPSPASTRRSRTEGSHGAPCRKSGASSSRPCGSRIGSPRTRPDSRSPASRATGGCRWTGRASPSAWRSSMTWIDPCPPRFRASTGRASRPSKYGRRDR